MGKEPEQPAPKDRTSNRGEGLTPELTGRVCLERAALALPATRRWLTPRGERELGRGPQERTRCPRPTGAQQSHQEDPEAGVTSRGSPHPERQRAGGNQTPSPPPRDEFQSALRPGRGGGDGLGRCPGSALGVPSSLFSHPSPPPPPKLGPLESALVTLGNVTC